MAEALTARGLAVTQIEQLPEVLPTVDPDLGALVHAELAARGVDVVTGATVHQISKNGNGQLLVEATGADGKSRTAAAGIVLVSTGVRPDTALARAAGAALGLKNAIAVDRGMRTNLPDVLAAGDCVVTHHRLLGETYFPRRWAARGKPCRWAPRPGTGRFRCTAPRRRRMVSACTAAVPCSYHRYRA
jgi:pyruvate/2-oxoglutarate dehydrogenase complex dihydrolipoamide dehydrogenase (E3) component